MVKVCLSLKSTTIFSVITSGSYILIAGNVARTAAVWSISSFVPSAMAAIIGKKAYPLSVKYLPIRSTSSSSTKSHLLPTTICILSLSSSLNTFNSLLIFSKSSMGSLPSLPEISITCKSSLHLSTWRKNSWPRPTPSPAPSIRPGMSAITNELPSPILTTPKTGVKVVKW